MRRIPEGCVGEVPGKVETYCRHVEGEGRKMHNKWSLSEQINAVRKCCNSRRHNVKEITSGIGRRQAARSDGGAGRVLR